MWVPANSEYSGYVQEYTGSARATDSGRAALVLPKQTQVFRGGGPLHSAILSCIAICSCQSAKVFLSRGLLGCSYMQILAAAYTFRYQRAMELALVNEICRDCQVS